MDAYEATKIVFSRIQRLDPVYAAEIMGLLLIQEHGEKEMIRLAFGPESLLLSVVLNARKDLGLLSPSSPSSVFLLGRQSSPPSSWASPSPFDEDSASGNELNEHSPLSSNSVVEQQFFPDERHRDGGNNRRSCSFSGLCLFFARGYCKNGSDCRFLHYDATAAGKHDDMVGHELLLRSGATSLPFSPSAASGKGINFLLQHQLQKQSESQRAAAAALAAGREEPQKFFCRPRLERCDFAGMVNPCSRQIYLTFPADSTFREEDVSIYFSIYGPVQDVRIPYQHKRMFGFVTFLYPETVKLILAKGNPHFVCDARVLVKPYKEKGKMLDKKQQQLGDWGDFSGCTTPTEIDSRDLYNLQQLGARTRYGSCRQDALVQKKLEEQQELLQAIELQQRRFMGLQLLDQTCRQPPPYAPVSPAAAAASPPPIKVAHAFTASSDSKEGGWIAEEKSQKLESGTAAAFYNAGQEEISCKNDGDSERSLEHNLPDSPFASPTKSSFSSGDSFASEAAAAAAPPQAFSTSALLSSTLLPATPALENLSPFRSCFFQMPWYSSGAGAVGL